jgi:tRNA modification GTPase
MGAEIANVIHQNGKRSHAAIRSAARSPLAIWVMTDVGSERIPAGRNRPTTYHAVLVPLMADHRETIFALSSGRPPSAIAVVRVSGPRAGDAVMALAGRLPAPRQAMLARLRQPAMVETVGDPATGAAPIDDALVLWFPGPRSETGEDTAEFQLHGGRAVVAAVLAALGDLPGLRPAESGEFTRRAFLNGKLDLTRVEGLADLIGAETEAQRRQAFRQLDGLLGERAERWRGRLIEALALVEALIDFPDEGGVPEDLVRPALRIAAELEQGIRALLGDAHRGERLRDGLTVAIAGPVNVGKSCIINRLAKRAAAIVSPQPGTTRDVIEVHLDLGGLPVTVLDTAGLRETDDPVELEGVRRAQARAAAADLVLWVVDATAGDPSGPPAVLAGADGPAVWIVLNKCDLMEGVASGGTGDGGAAVPQYQVSALTGASFDALIGGLSSYAERFFGANESSLITRQRHRTVLTSCAEALGRALAEGDSGREEVIAEELRLAARALGRLTGRVDVEDVLDVIFRDFCVGK